MPNTVEYLSTELFIATIASVVSTRGQFQLPLRQWPNTMMLSELFRYGWAVWVDSERGEEATVMGDLESMHSNAFASCFSV